MGSVEVHKDVPANRLITLVEGSPDLKAEKLIPAAQAKTAHKR
jgi:hypothetical protein